MWTDEVLTLGIAERGSCMTNAAQVPQALF
jgi:hypothetical protein